MTDYVFNWEDGNIDGSNTVNGPDGAVTVSISTPANGDGDSWFESTHTNGDSDTEVGSRSVKNATELNTTFSAPVANVSFEIFDVDSMAGSWDDKVTIIALDADGNQVPVTFSDLGFHTVNGNTIEGNGNSNPGVEGSGATDTVTVTIPGPIVSLQIIHDNGDSADTSGVVGLGSLNFDVVDTGNPGSDGPVDGENFGETMVLDYDDSNAPTDQGGDKITTGDDLIYGNGGDDYIEGDDGDDVIYGDSGDQTGETTTERVALEWSKAPAFGDFTLASDFSQTVGGVTVDVDFETNGSPLSIEYTSDEFNVDGIIDDGNPVNDESSIKFGSSNSDAAGTVDLNFSDEVENVSFRIADLDFAASVSVFAYDADGNLVPVTFVNEGVNVELEDENGDGVIETVEDANPTTGNPDTSDLNSVGVEIAGPVSRIEIVYDAESDLGSSTHISDIYFDATTTTDFGVPGNDTILGGEGDDVIFGEEGNDTLDGGEGVDTISGGDDRDTILGGAGDTVDGGAGGDDFDTLDLTGKGPFFLDNVVTDSNGNGIDGTVVFVDGDGNPTGETITFTEIEDIIGDNIGDGPDANDDTAETDEDTPVTIPVLANDTDPDGDPLTVTEATSPDGDVTINPDGTITFTPDPDFNGPTTITYTVEDPDGNEDTATVDVTVNPVNDAPVANDDTAETPEDTPVTIPVLDNDTDVDGDPLTVTEATSPDGDVTINPDGTITFTPDPDFSGPTTITYTVEDPDGEEDEGTVTVNVTPDPDDPIANDDTAETDEDTPVTIPVLANDTDPDGDPLTVTEATSPDGDVTINPDGTITFTPDPDFNGPTTITYTVEDPDGNEDTATVDVTVNPVNDAPVANDDTAETPEDTPVTIPVLDNDTDVDGDPLTVTEATSPDGDVTINPDGTITFTPDPDFSGPTTITYTVEDPDGEEDEGTVTVNVTPDPDDPIANDDTAETDEDTPVTIPVLANDTDPDGDPLTVTEATSPDGDVTINPDGTITFTPDPDFNGPTTITYTVEDPDGNEDTATVDVTVNPVNDAPVANDDTATTPEDTPVTIPVLANDEDVDGDPLTVTEATSPDGDVDINPDGTITFTPDPGFTGPATITYTIEDPDGEDDTAEVIVNVTNDPDAPVAVDDDGGETLTGTPVTIDALANDFDPDGDDLTIIAASVPADEGTVQIVDNKIVFTPAPGFEGPVTIDYTIEDEENLTDDAIITVNVRNGIVNGTDGNDVIDEDYLGDPGGDEVDNGDAVLPGEGPDDDIIDAGDGDDIIDAGAGDDDVDGGAGDDIIDTGEGSDTVDGGDGDDIIDTGANDPMLIDKSYPGVFVGEEGTPAIFDDRDTVFGGDGNDTISTGDDEDMIDGGDGDDIIDGGIDDDTILGGAGDDRIVGGEGEDVIDGGDGDDLIYAGNDPDLVPDVVNIEDDGSNPFGPDLRPDNGRDTVFGGEGNDTIFGADDADELFGEEGDDFIDGEIDDDFIDGGEGDDTLLGGQGDDTILGGDGNDAIDGGIGDDDLEGGADRDTFTNVNAGDTVDGGGAGDDFDVLDLRGSAPEDGSLEVTFTNPDGNGNGFDGFVTYFDEDGNETGTLTFTEIEDVIPCFTPGTLIATPRGEIAVEELQVGDRVITRDNGIQEIRWVGQRGMTTSELERSPHLKPIMIRKGALGHGLPERDMLVSPNHRVLVSNDKTALYFEEREVLVAAKHLTGLDGVEIADVQWTTYIHVMFDQHEVILSDGAWTESFQPGDMTLGSMGNAQRNEIFELFPELKTREGVDNYTAARRSLKKHEAQLLMQ